MLPITSLVLGLLLFDMFFKIFPFSQRMGSEKNQRPNAPAFEERRDVLQRLETVLVWPGIRDSILESEVERMSRLDPSIWMFPKIGVPKMDGENHRKTLLKWMFCGVFPLFLETPI